MYHSGQQKGGLHRKKGKKAPKVASSESFIEVSITHTAGAVIMAGEKLPPKDPLENCQVQSGLSACQLARVWVSPPGPNVGPPALGRAEYGPGALPSHPLSFLHLILSDHSDISTALLQLTSILFVFALMWKENRFRNLKNCLLSSDQLGLGCQSVSFAQVGRSKRHPKMWTLFLGCHSAL